MSYCFNPSCKEPENLGAHLCASCGFSLLLSDRFRATKVIGQGGFGKTYLAVDTNDNPCVIKQFCFPSISSTALRLFSEEAQRLKTLGSHPQIPTFVDYVEQENQYFIIQEYIDGSNLEEELAADGAFSASQIEQLLIDILPVIEFVHQGGVIHRDIKPENIIRRKSDRKLALVDFGAAKRATETALAKTGTTIGSAGYAAPEQTFGKAVIQSDLYSLGVTCVHLLTNLHPFDLIDSADGDWAWRDYLKQPVDIKLAQILDKLLERGTRQRYQSATEVLRDLQLEKEEIQLKVVEETTIRLPSLKLGVIISLLITGSLIAVPVVNNVLNSNPQVATIPQEQIRKSPVPKPIPVPQKPKLQPQKSQEEDEFLLTLITLIRFMSFLMIMLGFLSMSKAIIHGEDKQKGILLMGMGLISATVINALSPSVSSLESTNTNVSVERLEDNAAK